VVRAQTTQYNINTQRKQTRTNMAQPVLKFDDTTEVSTRHTSLGHIVQNYQENTNPLLLQSSWSVCTCTHVNVDPVPYYLFVIF
jgi:hypothetical protein